MQKFSSPLSYVPEPVDLMEDINDQIERLVSSIRRGKLGPRAGESFSTTVAIKTVQLMHNIVSLFRAKDETREGISYQMLHANFPADFVSTTIVRQLLKFISCAGESVLRAQFSTLLLTNVTRRVLSLIREAAVKSTATAAELEALAARWLNELDDEDDEYGGSMHSSTVPSGGPSPDRECTNDEFGAAPKPKARRLKKGLSVKFGFTDVADGLESPKTSPILTSGIPGKQTLRRAPSRREEEASDRAVEFPVRLNKFFDHVVDLIEDFKVEIEGMREDLCRRASKQLHASDTVITIGCSYTTRMYLLRAAEDCLKVGEPFKVIILEGEPFPASATQTLAEELTSLQVDVQVLPDSSAFAMMETCTKVLVGVDGVLANGGLLAPIGTHPLCIAAKHFAVPVLVVTTTLKMSLYYPRDALCTSLVKISRFNAQEIPWNTYGSPGDVLPVPCGESIDSIGGFAVHSPVTEYVPSDLVTLYATNESEYTPSQIHRIVRDKYNPED